MENTTAGKSRFPTDESELEEGIIHGSSSLYPQSWSIEAFPRMWSGQDDRSPSDRGNGLGSNDVHIEYGPTPSELRLVQEAALLSSPTSPFHRRIERGLERPLASFPTPTELAVYTVDYSPPAIAASLLPMAQVSRLYHIRKREWRKK